MITTPVDKQRAKSYYLGPNHGRHHDDNKSLGNNSVRVDQRKKSKNHRKDKNKSLERDPTNTSKYFKNTVKSVKKVFRHFIQNKSMSKSMNKSTSKHPKSPRRRYVD